MSESSSPVTPVFVAHPLCPPHLRKVGEDAVEAFDSAWLLPPQAGEVFESAKACLRRLQGYALSRGFAVVTTASVKDRARFACIHHGAETKNWRELEDHVEKGAEGSILTRRKRENTSANAKHCTWEVYWSVRSLGKRGSGVIAGQLGITRDSHNHVLSPNPFIYKVHEKGTAQYQQTVGLALGHRLAHQSYSSMRRVLDTSELRIDRKTYYNLVRGRPLEDGVSNDSFEGMVLALEEAGFRFACTMNDDLAGDGSLQGRVLEQVFFLLDQQIAYGKRFIADQVLLIDGTFETNRLGLVLLVVVGVTNTGKNFPAAYSFARSEARDSFDFIFECMKRFILTADIAKARVILGDQAPGLIASVPEAMCGSKLQHCATTLLNHQLSLAEACTRLAKGIRVLLKDLDEQESKSYGSTPRILDLQALGI